MHLKCDGLLLADVLEKFRNNSVKNYGLCPCHCLSATVLNFMTEVELGLIPDARLFLFFEKGIWDEALYISKKYSQVNNRYLKSSHSKQESKHIIYLQIIYIVMQCLNFLHQSGFKWIDLKDFD